MVNTVQLAGYSWWLPVLVAFGLWVVVGIIWYKRTHRDPRTPQQKEQDRFKTMVKETDKLRKETEADFAKLLRLKADYQKSKIDELKAKCGSAASSTAAD